MLIATARNPVEHLEEAPRLVGDVATRSAGAEEAGLAEAIAAMPQRQPSARQRRRRGQLRAVGDAAPRGEGGVRMPKHPLAVAQQELDLAVAGSALSHPGQPHPGRGEADRKSTRLNSSHH
jgi:hypothetical protein